MTFVVVIVVLLQIECDAVLFVKQFLTTQRIVVPSSSGSHSLKGLLFMLGFVTKLF